MSIKPRNRSTRAQAQELASTVGATPRTSPALGKSDRLSLIVSIVALVVSVMSVFFTAFDFLGSRAVVLFMEPKTEGAPSDPETTYLLRSASSDISILRVHMHFLALPKPGSVNIQILGPKLELTSGPFQKIGRVLATAEKLPSDSDGSCTGTIPLLIEVKYVAKGRVQDAAAFYHLAFDYFAATAQHPDPAGYVVLRYLEFNKGLSPWQSVRGQSLIAAPCDWTDTANDRNERDWTFVK